MMVDVAPLPDRDAADPGARPRARPAGRPARPGGTSRGRAPCCSPVTPVVGKTRLLRRAASTARPTAGWRVAGRALPRLRRQRAALPPVLRALRPARRRRPRGRRPADRRPHPALSHLQPGRRLIVRRRRRGRGRPNLDRSDLFEAIHGALDDLAERAAAAACVIEDVHWADRSTRDLLSFLFARAFRGPGRSCRVLPLRRPAPPPPAARDRGPVGPAARGPAGPARPAARRRRTRAWCRPCCPGRCPRASCTAIVRAGRGQRVLRRGAGRRRRGRAAAAGACPTTSPTCCWSGSTGSTTPPARWSGPRPCAGRRVSHAAARRGRRPARRRRSTRALRAAVEQNVLVPVGGDGYAFRHALLAEAVYDDLLPGERVRLHAAVRRGAAQPARRRHRRRAGPARPAGPRPGDRGPGQHRGRRRGDGASAGPRRRPRHYEAALELRRPTRRLAGPTLDLVDLAVKASEAPVASGHPERAVQLVRRPAAPHLRGRRPDRPGPAADVPGDGDADARQRRRPARADRPRRSRCVPDEPHRAAGPAARACTPAPSCSARPRRGGRPAGDGGARPGPEARPALAGRRRHHDAGRHRRPGRRRRDRAAGARGRHRAGATATATSHAELRSRYLLASLHHERGDLAAARAAYHDGYLAGPRHRPALGAVRLRGPADGGAGRLRDRRLGRLPSSSPMVGGQSPPPIAGGDAARHPGDGLRRPRRPRRPARCSTSCDRCGRSTAWSASAPAAAEIDWYGDAARRRRAMLRDVRPRGRGRRRAPGPRPSRPGSG